MIASVSGTVEALSPGSAVIEVGGIGVLVWCTPATLARLRVGERARLATTLVVRETELTLYGFAGADERDVFEILQGAAGVGPRLAQAVLGVHSPDVVRRAVAEEDLTTLTKVPGIGRKGAQRIVLDLRGKLGPPSTPGPRGGAAPAPTGEATLLGEPGEDVRDALVGLGYTAREAQDAVAAAWAALAPAGAHAAGVPTSGADGRGAKGTGATGGGATGGGADGGAGTGAASGGGRSEGAGSGGAGALAPPADVDRAALLRASLAMLRPR